MPLSPKTFLFGDDRIATATSGRNDYGHTFGGPHDRRGTAREHCDGILIHLLHRLNLDDPAVPITIPGIRWLPLYYCFDFRANELGYRLLSDESLVTFFPPDEPHLNEPEEWPDEDYPAAFPQSSIQVSHYDYDPTRFEDAYTWCGIFGIGKLSASDQAKMKKRIAEEMDDLGLGMPQSDEEFQEALGNPFVQGKPNTTCLNPDCPNHTKNGQLSTIALLPAEPVRGVHTFGSYGADVELIFQICDQCHTIRVSNQCG